MNLYSTLILYSPSSLPPSDTGQWWELSDDTRDGLSYYYHTLSGETRWEKPDNEFVIPLRVIQVRIFPIKFPISLNLIYIVKF